jgi:hypothetical protein
MPTDWMSAYPVQEMQRQYASGNFTDMASCCSSWKSRSDHREITGAEQAANKTLSAACQIDLNQGAVL